MWRLQSLSRIYFRFAYRCDYELTARVESFDNLCSSDIDSAVMSKTFRNMQICEIDI